MLFLGIFGPDIAIKKIRNIIFLINSTRAFDRCINCHIWMRKHFIAFFVRVSLCGQRDRKFFITKISPNRVDKKYDVSKNVLKERFQ